MRYTKKQSDYAVQSKSNCESHGTYALAGRTKLFVEIEGTLSIKEKVIVETKVYEIQL